MKKLKIFFLRIFLIFLKRNSHFFFKDHPRILIITTTGLGDTLWGTPALQDLRDTYPFAFIGVLTNHLGKEVLKNHPAIDEIFLLKKPLFLTFFSLRKKLFQKKFGAVLIFHASQRLIFALAACIGSEKLVSTKGRNKNLDFLFTDLCEAQKEHEIERRQTLIEKIGVSRKNQTLTYKILPQEKKEVLKLLKTLDISMKKPLILIHPGAKDSYKCWPLKNYSVLGKLLQNAGTQILISGSNNEQTLKSTLASHLPGALVLPLLSLPLFAALIKEVDLLITNDTGPMHLACAIDQEVITLFAPTNPKSCGPNKAAKAHLIAKPKTCTLCLQRACRDPFCLLQISSQEVFDAALNILHKKGKL